jgi:hypothetical protein
MLNFDSYKIHQESRFVRKRIGKQDHKLQLKISNSAFGFFNENENSWQVKIVNEISLWRMDVTLFCILCLCEGCSLAVVLFSTDSRWLARVARPMWMCDKVEKYVNQSCWSTRSDDFFIIIYNMESRTECTGNLAVNDANAYLGARLYMRQCGKREKPAAVTFDNQLASLGKYS